MKKIVCVAAAAVLVLIAAFLLSVPFINDHIAEDTERGLKKIPLPEATEFIESVSCAGKLVGNGNGMQYFGALLLKSELSADELQAYYSDAAKNSDLPECFVKEQSGKKIDAIEHRELQFECDDFSGGFYIVYAWGNYGGLFSELDIRGH